MPRTAKNLIVCQFFSWNLYKRDDVWYADGRTNKPNLGKHSLGTRNFDEAVQLLRELDRRKAMELKMSPSQATAGEAISIEDGWAKYTEHIARAGVLGGASLKTQQRYRAVRDKHVRYCDSHGPSSWDLIDKRHIQAYGSFLSEKGYSDATIYLECTLLKQSIKWFIEEKVLPESHRVHLPLRRSEESDAYCYTRVEVTAMLQLCRAQPHLGWLADVIVGLATTGMRIGELAGLRWCDVKLESRVIKLTDNRHSSKAKNAGATRTTKGRRSRDIDIHQDLLVLLRELPHRADGKVFGGLKHGPLDPDKVLKVLKRDVIEPLKATFPPTPGEIGFADGCVHSFRHYFVTEAFAGGASESEIMAWVGHRDSRIVRRYRHLRREAAQCRMQQLSFIGGGAEVTANTSAKGGDETTA